MAGKASEQLRWWKIDLAGLAACGLVSVGVYFVLIAPATSRQAEQREMAQSLSQKSQEVGEARSRLVQTRKDLEQTLAEVKALPLTLESAGGVNQRLANLAGLATEAGLEVHQLQPRTARSGTRYDTIPITLNGMGDYRKVTAFLHDLHVDFADVGVVRFNLAADNPSGADSLRFELGLVWYTTPTLSLVEEK